MEETEQNTKHLNYELYKEQAIYYKMATRQMLLSILKKAPKEQLIEVLQDLKIISRDWLSKSEKYKLRENTSKK